MKRLVSSVCLLALAAGCATGYSWKPSVPEKMRTVAVPVFRNEAQATELGPIVTRQILREFQREGTFKLSDEPALEIQGVIKGASPSLTSYDRRTGLRHNNYDYRATAVVSVIDKVNGKILINNRSYDAAVTFISNEDILSSMRDASGRIAEELARQIVDDVLGIKWKE